VEHIAKRAFITTAILVACLLLGFSAVALAKGPEALKTTGRHLGPGARAASEQPLVASRHTTDVTIAVPETGSTAPLRGLELIRFTAGTLKPESLLAVDQAMARNRALEWSRAVEAEGSSPIAALGEILPSFTWFQARLVTKRDEPDLILDANAADEYGRVYTELKKTLVTTKATSAAIEAVITEVWRFSDSAAKLEPGPAAVLKTRDRWLPAKSQLGSSHQYALDIFFTSVKRHGSVETGPTIRSMSRGVVVAAAGDWNGGDKPSLYRAGGLSPKAGNGAIIFDPDQGRYYAYFHLSDVSVRAGQVVSAGDVLGKGGNTGVNARKKDHGGHVHIEIHDVEGGAWTSYKIRDLIVSIH
jgi:murein DD-endopeptidase MepM/ murein hydrolase activator NlpD